MFESFIFILDPALANIEGATNKTISPQDVVIALCIYIKTPAHPISPTS